MGKKKRQFLTDEDGFVNVYIVGRCVNSDRKVSASGYGIYWGPRNACKVFGPCKREAKNDVADIQSAYIAIITANQLGVTKMRINTDSELVLNAADYLTDEEKEYDWMDLYNSQSAVDRRCFRKFKKAICNNPHITIEFERVINHLGNEHYGEADHLAGKGIELHCNYEKLLSVNLLQLNLN